jgi:hypothetical protein
MAAKKRKQLRTWIGPHGSERLVNCIENPSDEEILDELTGLPGGDQISCINLRISQTDHMSMAGSVDESFYLCYQEFSEAGKYESPDSNVPLALAMKIIVSYRDGNDYWHTAIKWRRVKIESHLADLNEEREIRECRRFVARAVGFLWGLFDGSKK